MKTLAFAALSSALLVGCTSVPPRDVLPEQSPTSANLGVRSSQNRDIIGNYNHRVPVSPRPWRALNDEQSPNKGGKS